MHPSKPICRVCGKASGGRSCKQNLFEDTSLIEIITSLLQIKIVEDPHLPNLVCTYCVKKLEDFKEYQTMCLKANEELIKQKNIKQEEDLKNIQEEPEFKYEMHDVVVPSVDVEIYVKNENEELKMETDQNLVFADEIESEIKEEESENDLKEEPRKVKKRGKYKKMDKKKPLQPKQYFPCTIEGCKRYCRTELGLKRHIDEHEGLKPTCEICGKSFSRYEYLEGHMLELHSENPIEYKCVIPGCGKIMYRKRNFEVHTRLHDEDYKTKQYFKTLFCEICGKSFRGNAKLSGHMKVHKKEYKFQCDKCDKKYWSKELLKRHMLSHGERTCVCVVCGAKFYSRKQLKGHNYNMHSAPGTRKTYDCTICNGVFKSTAGLRKHVSLVHLGEKPFPCEICDLSFGQSSTLKDHMMIHTGEKPRECSFCGKRFIQRGPFKAHMKSHANV